MQNHGQLLASPANGKGAATSWAGADTRAKRAAALYSLALQAYEHGCFAAHLCCQIALTICPYVHDTGHTGRVHVANSISFSNSATAALGSGEAIEVSCHGDGEVHLGRWANGH